VASDLLVSPNSVPADKFPYIIALTGGIASGKTMVSDEFARLGAPIIDTDIIAHEIVEPGQIALQDIESAFGSKIIDDHGRLRRRELRSIIFSDSKAREKLESILHPRIRQAAVNAISRVTSDYCILVIPLLTEKEGFPGIDRVLVVDVESETQISRLMARDNSSRKQARQALASQLTRKERLNLADDILDNTGSPEQARQQAEQLHKKYTRLAARR